MDRKAASRLEIGTQVRFSDGVLGKVIDTSYCAVTIAWDDGQTGVIHLEDMRDVSRDLSVDMARA